MGETILAKSPISGANGTTAAGGSKKSIMVVLAVTGIALAFAVALSSILLLVIGMAPTLVAFGLDRGPTRCAGRSVGMLNFCGVAPYLGQLWIGDHSLGGLGEILLDATAWLFMYGSAGLGWLLCYSMPSAVAMYLTVRDERQVGQLRSRQKVLVKEWGPAVGRMIKGGGGAD